MTIIYDKLMALEIPPAEQAYEPKDCMLYALGVGLGHDPMNEDELAVRLRKEPESAADHGHRAWPCRLLGARPRNRHRLGQRGQWRAGLYLAPSARRPRHRDRPNAHRRRDRQRRRQGRAGFHRAPGDRQGDRRIDRHRHADDVLPRRRRLRRPAAPGAGAASNPGARARCRLRSRHAPGNSADLPA